MVVIEIVSSLLQLHYILKSKRKGIHKQAQLEYNINIDYLENNDYENSKRSNLWDA